MKDKNNMISLIEVVKFDKIQYPFMIENPKLGIDGNFVNMIKIICVTPTANTYLFMTDGKLSQ